MLPYVTVSLTGTLVGKLWQSGSGSKPLDARVVKQAGRKDRTRLNLEAWVKQLTKDGDFDGPCVIEEALVTVTREFPAGLGRTYVVRKRHRFYDVLSVRS